MKNKELLEKLANTDLCYCDECEYKCPYCTARGILNEVDGIINSGAMILKKEFPNIENSKYKE